jgi:hypothetical protein
VSLGDERTVEREYFVDQSTRVVAIVDDEGTHAEVEAFDVDVDVDFDVDVDVEVKIGVATKAFAPARTEFLLAADGAVGASTS